MSGSGISRLLSPALTACVCALLSAASAPVKAQTTVTDPGITISDPSGAESPEARPAPCKSGQDQRQDQPHSESNPEVTGQAEGEAQNQAQAQSSNCPAWLPGQLRRVDFRVLGSTCPACLHRMVRTLSARGGVLRCDASIYRPYWAFVIYDSSRISLGKIADSLKSERMRLTNVQERDLSELPPFLTPRLW